jgi:hypothetical protein
VVVRQKQILINDCFPLCGRPGFTAAALMKFFSGSPVLPDWAKFRHLGEIFFKKIAQNLSK